MDTAQRDVDNTTLRAPVGGGVGALNGAGGEFVAPSAGTSPSAASVLTLVREQSAIPLDPRVPFDRACLIGCGIMTGMTDSPPDHVRLARR